MSGVVSRSGLWIMSVWKRPLTQRALPLTGASSAVVTPMTRPSFTLRSKLQPVPHSGQVVRTRVTSHSRAVLSWALTSAPVGQASVHWPQETQPDSR